MSWDSFNGYGCPSRSAMVVTCGSAFPTPEQGHQSRHGDNTK